MKRRSFIQSTTLAALTLPIAQLVGGQTKNSGRWQALADLPFPVQEIYPAIYNNRIHVAGGFAMIPGAERGVTDQHVIYDIAANTWQSGEPLPELRHHPNLIVCNNELFALGGFKPETVGAWVMQSQVWAYDFNNNHWAIKKPAPEPHGETVCLALNKYVHVVSGRIPKSEINANWGDHIDTDRHLLYDPVSDTWQKLAPAMSARNSAAGAVINNQLYIVGGRTVESGNVDTLEIYDPAEDKWRLGAPMPQAQGGLGAAALNNKLIAFGGEYFGAGGRGVYQEAWCYDPMTDQWDAVAPMLTPRHGLGAVSDGNNVYAIAGAVNAGGNGTSAKFEMFSFTE